MKGSIMLRSLLRQQVRTAASATSGSSRAISTRVAGIGNNVFAEISLLAAQHGAVNLGQGFPSFQTPECGVLFICCCGT